MEQPSNIQSPNVSPYLTREDFDEINNDRQRLAFQQFVWGGVNREADLSGNHTHRNNMDRYYEQIREAYDSSRPVHNHTITTQDYPPTHDHILDAMQYATRARDEALFKDMWYRDLHIAVENRNMREMYNLVNLRREMEIQNEGLARWVFNTTRDAEHVQAVEVWRWENKITGAKFWVRGRQPTIEEIASSILPGYVSDIMFSKIRDKFAEPELHKGRPKSQKKLEQEMQKLWEE